MKSVSLIALVLAAACVSVFEVSKAVYQPKPNWTWTQLEEKYVYVGQKTVHGKIPSNSKIASFDFDDTIAKTKTGKWPPTGGDDYELWDVRLPSIFKNLTNTHRFVIFTNQVEITEGKITADDVKQRIEGLVELLEDKGENKTELPVTVFVAYKANSYKKPQSGMFDLYCTKKYAEGKEVNTTESFFVGDAAGRPRDFAASDYHFALNAGLNFLTPEQFLKNYGNLSADNLSRLMKENKQSLPRMPEKFHPYSFMGSFVSWVMGIFF